MVRGNASLFIAVLGDVFPWVEDSERRSQTESCYGQLCLGRNPGILELNHANPAGERNHDENRQGWSRPHEALASRVDLTLSPTPLHALPRFSQKVGVEVWAKRDDIGSVGLLGNKVRELG